MTPKIYPLIATLLTLAALVGCGGPPLAQPEATPRSPVATPSAEAADVAVAQAPPTAPPIPPTAPPPPTPALSPLDESLQTIIFTTSGEQGPEIWRVQVDEAGQKAGPVTYRSTIGVVGVGGGDCAGGVGGLAGGAKAVGEEVAGGQGEVWGYYTIGVDRIS